MTIRVHWDVESEEELTERIEGAVAAALSHGGRTGHEIDVIIVSEETLARIHEDFMGDASVTDVIAFDLAEGGELGENEGPQGEIYVSLDRARVLAKRRGVALGRELVLYAVHGALHLCGFDDHDDDDRRRMREAEGVVLGELGYPPDDAPHEFGT
jgi:probable rRNA maturation factor